jgi:thiol-disulfide isomerase/thioredoxin
MNKVFLIGATVLSLLCSTTVVIYKKSHKAKDADVKSPSNWPWKNEWEGGKAPPSPEPKKEDGGQSPVAPPVEAITAKSYEDAKELSGKFGRPILIFFTAEWCQYCQRMKSDVLPKPEVKTMMAKYIFLTIDVDTNRAVAKEFGVQKIPASVVTNMKGEKLKHEEKSMAADQYVAWLNDPKLFNQPKGDAPKKVDPPKEQPKEKKRLLPPGRRRQSPPPNIEPQDVDPQDMPPQPRQQGGN